MTTKPVKLPPATTRKDWKTIAFFMFSALMFLALNAWPQQMPTNPSGTTGINNATQQVTSYFNIGVTLMYAIGAVVGIVGAVKVYQKWNQGDQDTAKTASAWFGSCIFLIVVAAILRGFFGMPA